MLTITIEILPGGFAPARRTIATMTISNVSDLSDISDYLIDAVEGENRLAGTRPRIAGCTVVGHDRNQSVWALVEKAAAALRTADFVDL